VLDNEESTFTVFAPANSAFDPYDVDLLLSNPGLLGSVLDYHVVAGDTTVSASELDDGDAFPTVQGENINVSTDADGNALVEGAQVTTANVEAGNAQIHLIDKLLLNNRTLLERLQITLDTKEMFTVVDTSGLGEDFGDPANSWTTFAPNNQAFENADLSGLSGDEIREALRYHVLPGVTDSESLQTLLDNNGGQVSVETLQGEDLTITEESDDTIDFNDGQATLNLDRVNQRASNGIIHLIDGVLLPPSFSSN
jgi:uncharacterized surface protein with fasciclin (FAS1) repeats